MGNLISSDLNEVINYLQGVFLREEDAGKQSIHYSDNVLELTGYTRTEFESGNVSWNSLILKDDVDKYLSRLGDFERDPANRSLVLDYRISAKDGKVVPVSERISVVRGSDGKILKKSGLVIDVTGYMQEIDEVKRLNVSKDNFLSIISHDLRAPFTSILGFAEIIRNENKLSEKDKVEYVNYIYDSSKILLQLVNNLLDWSQLQTGRIKLEVRSLNARSFAENCVSYLSEAAAQKNIKIAVKIPGTFFIDADEKLLTKVFMNLIGNAVKYSFENNTVEITSNYKKGFIEFIVKDNGVGISPANREKIFDIGQIFSTAGTLGEKGSGLGLMLAKQIVEKHDGRIWFFSEEGKGSEFHFTLPASSSDVLLALSDKEQLNNLETILRQLYQEHKIIIAESAPDALDIIAAKPPSLVITEHNLPKMTGLQLIEKLCKNEKNILLPFIVFINAGSEDVIKAYREYGAEILNQKPQMSGQLKEKIDSLIYK
jgi:two-component system sensor histidine kinase/response regulator